MKVKLKNRKVLRKEKRKEKKQKARDSFETIHGIKNCNKAKNSKFMNKKVLAKVVINATNSSVKNKKVDDETPSNGLKFSNNISSRMAALQSFIENETGTKFTQKNELKNGTTEAKTTKPEKKMKKSKRINDLEKDMESDDKEIKQLQRGLQLNAKQKKNNNRMMVNVFGSDISELIDILDYEPGSEFPITKDVISDTPTSVTESKKKSKYKNRISIPLPDNTIRIDTSTLFSDNTCALAMDILPKKKSNSSDLSRTPEKKGRTSYDLKENTAFKITPIIKKQKQGKYCSHSKNISFSLKNTKVRLIPTIEKQNGFIVEEIGEDSFVDISDHEVPNFLNNESILSLCDDSDSSEDQPELPERKQNSIHPKVKRVTCNLKENDLFYENNNFINEDDSDIEKLDDSSDEVDIDENNFDEDSDCSEENDIDCEDVDMVEEFSDMEAEFSDYASDVDMVAEFSDDNSETGTDKSKESMIEDIYGRLRDGKGNVITNEYLAPSNEREDLEEQLSTPQMKKVRTQLRGILNRLAEANLQSNTSLVTTIFNSHPRHLVNVIMFKLLLNQLGGVFSPTERNRQECAVLVVGVTVNVGQEVAAHILTEFVMAWHKGMKSSECDPDKLNNLVLFVAQLYNFGVVHSVLLVGILKMLVENLTSSTVDQLINILSSIGFKLRKDDPISLKHLIVDIQQKSETALKDIPQLEHLLAVIRAVKNNNESKLPNYDPTYVNQVRKHLKNITKNDAVFNGSLRVTLEDLLLSEVRGRWWVVGSAWTGASLCDQVGSKDNNQKMSSPVDKSQFTVAFMKMAESMGITRSPKINILFALTVGSDDNTQAFKALLALNLQQNQERFIFDVMLFCVQKIKVYRNFFTLVSRDLCQHDAKKYKRLLQFSLYDKFSDLDSLKGKEIDHLATFTVELLKYGVLYLSVLKTLPFADTSEKIANFLKNVLVQLFDANEGCHVSEDLFRGLLNSPKLRTFRIQIKMFISMFIIPMLNEGKLKPTNILFKKRVDNVITILSVDQGACL